MGGDAEPTGTGGGDDSFLLHVAPDDAAIDPGFAERDDAGAGFRGTGSEKFVAFGEGAGGDAIGKREDGRGDVGYADLIEVTESGLQAEAADRIEGAGFVAAGIGAEGHVAGGVVGVGGGVGPAKFDRIDLVLAVALDVENAAAFGAGEPFVAIGGGGVDAAFTDVEGEGTEALDGIDEEEDIVTVADFADGFQVGAVTGEELNEGDGQKAGSFGGAVNFVQGSIGAEPGDFYAAGLETDPGVLVGGKLVVEGDDAVAGAPIESKGDGGDAFGGIFNNCNFAGVCVAHFGRFDAEGFVAGHPLVVVEGAKLFGIGGEPAHGFGGGAAERGDGGVIEVYQVFGYGKGGAVALPQVFAKHLETHRILYA